MSSRSLGARRLLKTYCWAALLRTVVPGLGTRTHIVFIDGVVLLLEVNDGEVLQFSVVERVLPRIVSRYLA